MLIQAREDNVDAVPAGENQDQILIVWPTGERATLSISVVHAVIILLTYGSQCTDRAYLYYDCLLNMWFPQQKSLMPKVRYFDFVSILSYFLANGVFDCRRI